RSRSGGDRRPQHGDRRQCGRARSVGARRPSAALAWRRLRAGRAVSAVASGLGRLSRDIGVPQAAQFRYLRLRLERGRAMTRSGVERAVIVICDSLRADLIDPEATPFLAELRERAASFAAHRSVFPSTTRASAASIATGCRPARHGLLGNTMALDEGDGLVCHSAGAPDFRDRMRRATVRTFLVPPLAERLRRHGETSISCANVSPGAASFQDPDGHGWVHHAAGSFGPGRVPVDDPASAGLTKGLAGGRVMTERFCSDVLEERAPSVAILWLSEPDSTGHHAPP